MKRKIVEKIKLFFTLIWYKLHQISNKEARKAISCFFFDDAGFYTDKSNNYDYLRDITNIRSYKFNNVIKIRITTKRPGVLIGPKGRTVNALNQHLDMWFKSKTFIIIEDCPLFRNLY